MMAELVRQISVLDHGYVRYVEHWGSDERIIEAARMSTQKGFEGWGEDSECDQCGGKGTEELSHGRGPGSVCKPCGGNGRRINKPGDEKLLRYLWEHKHATPFEMAGVVFEVQAPIFVFREWHRHRTQSYNEMSARYVPLPDVNYVPTVERLMMSGGSNKQAQGTGDRKLDEIGAKSFQYEIGEIYSFAQGIYEKALKSGVPKELARLVLPVARYSRMRASANLRNWLGFLTLRMDKNAQWEIQQYANAVAEFLYGYFPRTMNLFEEGRT